MTSLVGKVSGSVAALYNENSLALANLNLDFTLVKLEVPREFDSLALSLSKKRKADAEDGALHRTARKLGALFEGSLPPTQGLLRAYGKRVSEISSMPMVNPKSTDRDNIFAGQIGLDAASIWAAATSGAGAIAVHLLACMLSRMFTSSEATSVWVELVEKQKEKIFKERDEDLYREKYNGPMVAAQQEILRNDLANWDASARAWLQSADQAKERQHKQMMLILNNASIPINNEPNTHSSVMKAWTTTLRAMESLLKGMPQQVQDGAALLGISSWHMYPDILLFGDTTVEVKQKDPLFEDTAVLTLGLEITRGHDRSVSWSLPLARLQYYGDPVHTSRSAGPDNSRITPEQFSWVVIGCLFDTWGEFARSSEDGLSWLQKLTDFVREPLCVAMRGYRALSHYRDQSYTDREYGMMWFEYLDVAAQNLATCDLIDREIALQLVSLGRRKSTFLYPNNNHPLPLFGLTLPSNLVPLMQTDEIRLELLRKLASRQRLSRLAFIIRYKPSNSPFDFEYASVRRLKWTPPPLQDKILRSMKHVRWLPVGIRELEEICEKDEDPHFRRTSPFWRRYDRLTHTGNLCFPVLENETNDKSTISRKTYLIDGDVLATAKVLLALYSENEPGRPSLDFQPRLITGAEEAAIFQIAHSKSYSHFSADLEPRDMGGYFTPEKLDVEKVTKYLIRNTKSEVKPRTMCAVVSNIFSRLSHATISTLVLSQNLGCSRWVESLALIEPIPKLSRAQAFACISMFETGICDLDPASLFEVFAISSGNSLFVANELLTDPHEEVEVSDIRRMVGNIGRAGLSLLIPPPRPKTRPADLGNWKSVNHIPFDGTFVDSFHSTSVHLSFTEYEMPLHALGDGRHEIDRPINLMESLISVYDRGKWIADLDALKAFRHQGLHHNRDEGYLHRQFCIARTNVELEMCMRRPKITFLEASKTFPGLKSTSIDNWEELLDRPKRGTMIIRAHGNWLARLALTAVCANSDLDTIILGKEPCWSCCGMLIQSIGSSNSHRSEVPTQRGIPVTPTFTHGRGRDSDSEEDGGCRILYGFDCNQRGAEARLEENRREDVGDTDGSLDDSSVEGSTSDDGETQQGDYSGRMIALIY